MQRYLLFFSIFVLTVATVTSCSRANNKGMQQIADSEESSVAKQTGGSHYAPNYVQVKGDNVPFDSITFKDVGIDGVTDDTRNTFFADVATAIATQLEQKENLNITELHTGENPQFADPSYHLACGFRHIYVDAWRNKERTGYSLWSGCSEDENFAWVEYPNPAKNAPQQLGEKISESILHAIDTHCFIKSCQKP